MLITREKIEEGMLSILPNKEYYLKKENSKDLSLIVEYALNGNGLKDKEKQRLEELYERIIELAKEQIKSEIKIEDIESLVSFVSLAPIQKESYKALPFEKSLKVFPNVKKIYLIYSETSEVRFYEIKKKLESKNLEIIGKLISWDRIEEIYTYLISLVKSGEISSKSCVLDLTLGMKITGIAMYKLAVIRDIKIINWKSSHFPLYKYDEVKGGYISEEKAVIIPFSETLEVLEEPIQESRKQYFLLNKMIDEKNYKVLSEYYLNFFEKEDLYFFFKELASMFSFEMIFMLRYEDFYKRVKKFTKSMLNYEKFEEDTKNKIKSFVYFLEILSDGDDIKYYENYSKLNLLEREKLNVENVLVDGKKALRSERQISFEEAVYICLISQFIINNIKDKSKRDILFENLKDILLINIKESKAKEDLSDFDQIEDFLFKKKLEKIHNIMDVSKNFKKSFEKEILFENGILKLENFGIKIDLVAEESLLKYFKKNTRKPKKTMKIFEFLVSKGNYYLSPKETEERLKSKKGSKDSLNKESSNLLKLYNEINKVIREKTGKDADFILTYKILDKELKKNEFKINKVFYE